MDVPLALLSWLRTIWQRRDEGSRCEVAAADARTKRLTRWFVAYCARADAVIAAGRPTWSRLLRPDRGEVFLCPCCRLPTLRERGVYSICLACFWEDDGQDDPHADEAWGGPNHHYTLSASRANFAAHLTMYAPGDQSFERLRGGELALAAKRRMVEAGAALRASPDLAEAVPPWGRFDAAEAELRAILYPQ